MLDKSGYRYLARFFCAQRRGAVYTIRFADAAFVVHCFKKRRKRGIAMPTVDLDIIRARLKVVEQIARELTT